MTEGAIMVRSTEQRTANYIANNDPRVTYLRLKALLRRKALNPAIEETVKALKLAHGKALIDPYNLSARGKQNATQAWQELYYHFYLQYQRVEYNGS